MSSLITNYTGNYVWNQLIYSSAGTKVKVALHTDNPGVLGSSANEVSGGSYERQLTTWSVPSSKTIANTREIVFDDMPDCTVFHIALWTNDVSPQCVAVIELASPISVDDGKSLKIPANNLAFSL